MTSFFLKSLLSGMIIAFCSWLSIKRPQLAGFIIALPLVSMIALVLSYFEHQNKDQTVIFAKSILIGIPLSLLFFVPFLLAKYLSLNFWSLFFLGILFLICGFFVHRFITQFF
tara:strand:+ start:238 stop:576 length:339 start_codon:yes stop_codon:yes gene_type:complete